MRYSGFGQSGKAERCRDCVGGGLCAKDEKSDRRVEMDIGNKIENKVIVSVAPVSAVPHDINAQALADEIVRCCSEGASMVHLHVRDKGGCLTDDLSEFSACVERVRQLSDIVIQASTGGISEMNIIQRCAPLYLPTVETCSLNVGSVNLGAAVYQNPIGDVETCVNILLEQKKMPEIEIFELGMVGAVRRLDKKLGLPRPTLMNLVVGHEGGCPAEPGALTALWQYMGESFWGFTHAHRRDFGMMACALGLGARLVRIGLEDSPYLNGGTVNENPPLVAALVKLIRAIGLEPATPQEARIMLGI